MFDFSQIPLFPIESSSITVTTTVWIGVLVAVFFNLRLGWTLSALVVPGYVVPLIISRPTTAVVILVEAVVTYLLAIWISESNRKHPYWSSLFGRDRFFLIVVISILVRAAADGWLLPMAGRYLVEELKIDFDYRNELSSFGLIAVALIANYFWKPGVKRGLPCLLTCVGLTWAFVVCILVPFTNFNIASFDMLYEDISTSMLASPKAYIIILITGWFASWVNLRYAWDFNGILIPALMALLWPHPDQILVSLIEAFLVLMTGKMLISTSLCKNLAIQGGRKLAFFFSICFFYRFATAHFLSHFAPELKVTDFFGMGYLLSTLIAIRIYDKKVPIRMTKGILQVSAVGAVMASVIGFTIDRVGIASQNMELVASQPVINAAASTSTKSITELFKEEKIRLYRNEREPESSSTAIQRLKSFEQGLAELAMSINVQKGVVSESALDGAASIFAAANYEIVVAQNRQIVLRELEPFQGKGWFVLSPLNTNCLSVIAPNSIDEKWCGESAIYLHDELNAGAIAVFGDADSTTSIRPIASEAHQRGFLDAFQHTFARNSNLVVRSISDRDSKETTAGRNVLAVENVLPANIDLPKLKQVAGEFDVRWKDQAESSNHLRDRGRGVGKVTAYLATETRRQMIARSVVRQERATKSDVLATHMVARDLSLGDWFLSVKDEICAPGTDCYSPPKPEELLFLDETVIQPIIEIARREPTESALQELRAVNNEASSLGYCVRLIKDRESGAQFIALQEQFNHAHRLGWGTAVFRWGMKSPWSVEIPRPESERRSFEFGTSIFQHPGASVLFVAGAHPNTNRDGSSDLTKSANRRNLMNLLRHILFRELGDRPWLTVQTRSIQAPITSDIVVATDNGAREVEKLTPMQRQLCDTFASAGLSIEFVDGREDVAGYELGLMLRASSTQISANKEIMSLWLSPGLRSVFRQQDPYDNLNAQLRACGLRSSFSSRQQLLVAASSNRNMNERANGKTQVAASVSNNDEGLIPHELRSQLIEFAMEHDVVRLYSVMRDFDKFQFERFFDVQTKSTLIAILNKEGTLVALLNPRGLNDRRIKIETLTSEELHEFILSRSLFLEVIQ